MAGYFLDYYFFDSVSESQKSKNSQERLPLVDRLQQQPNAENVYEHEGTVDDYNEIGAEEDEYSETDVNNANNTEKESYVVDEPSLGARLDMVNKTIKICIVGPSGVGKSKMMTNSVISYPDLVHKIIVDEHDQEAYLNSVRMTVFEIFRTMTGYKDFQALHRCLITGKFDEENPLKEPKLEGKYGPLSRLIGIFRDPRIMSLSEKMMLERFNADVSAGFIETHYLAFGSGQPIVFIDSLRGAKYSGGSAMRFGVSSRLKTILQNLSSANLGKISVTVLPVELREEQRVLEELARAYSDIVISYDSTFFITCRLDG